MSEATTLEVLGKVDAKPLYNRIDALEGSLREAIDKNAALEARIEAVEKQRQRAATRINAIEAGCLPDEPKFDNGPAINRLLDNCGLKAGNYREEIYFPGGRYYHSTPIVFPIRTALSVVGNGCGPSFHNDAHYGDSQLAGPTALWIYTGPGRDSAGNSIAAVTYPGAGTYMRGINLQRGEYPLKRVDAAADGSVGLRVTCYTGMPSAMGLIEHLRISGFDKGVESARRTPDSAVNNNSDNLHFGYVLMQNNNVAFSLNNYQAVDWTFDHITFAFQTNVAFDCIEVAHVQCSYAVFNSEGIVIARVGEPGNPRRPGSNNAFLDFSHCKVDPTCKSWTLVEQRVPCTFALDAKVFAGNKHVLDEKLVKLVDNTGYGRTIRAQVLQHGVWWNWNDGKFVPAADNPAEWRAK